jgi:hypothetical protein
MMLHDPLCQLEASPDDESSTCICFELRLARLQGPVGMKHAAICWCPTCVANDGEKSRAIVEAKDEERQRIADAIYALTHADCSDDCGCREWGNMDRILAGES